MRALVTGFEPFGGESVNPTAATLDLLPERVGGLRIARRILPVSFERASAALAAAIEDSAPDVVLATGEAGGRAALSLERVAINLADARIPDNDGDQPIDCPVVPDGPAAYFATIPLRPALAALVAAGLPAALSDSAGTFVCNHLFYRLMHLAAARRPLLRAGFLHVPYLPEQAARHPGAASMAAQDIARGIAILLRSTAAPL